MKHKTENELRKTPKQETFERSLSPTIGVLVYTYTYTAK